jgi:hypothetical protein
LFKERRDLIVLRMVDLNSDTFPTAAVNFRGGFANSPG